MPEYKVTRVSQQPPRQWQGPHGIVYYILVQVEGHPKPLSVGKKSPDALKVGDTIYGDIQPDPEHGEDKFKAAPMGQGGFQQATTGGVSTAKPAYQPKDEAAIKAMWAIGQAVSLLRVEGGKVPANQAIELWADTFFEMVNRVKNGERPDTAPRTVVPEPITTTDEDLMSLAESVMGPVTTDNIPMPEDWWWYTKDSKP